MVPVFGEIRTLNSDQANTHAWQPRWGKASAQGTLRGRSLSGRPKAKGHSGVWQRPEKESPRKRAFPLEKER